MVEVLQLILLLFRLLPDADELVEKNGRLLLGLDLVSVVFTQLGLHEVAHLGQLCLRLRLQALDEVLHL